MADKSEGNEIVTYATYQCLLCGFASPIRGKKKDYKEVNVCPKCKGAFVDRWKIHKYKDLSNMQLVTKEEHNTTVETDFFTCKDWNSDTTTQTIKQLKSIQREARKATAALKEKQQLENKYLEAQKNRE